MAGIRTDNRIFPGIQTFEFKHSSTSLDVHPPPIGTAGFRSPDIPMDTQPPDVVARTGIEPVFQP